MTYHNIVGMTPTKKLFKETEATGDGVVSFESAHADDAVSEVIVNEDHQDIHRNPKSILEVRRVLIEHLTQLRDEFRAEQLAKAAATNRLPNGASAQLASSPATRSLTAKAQPRLMLQLKMQRKRRKTLQCKCPRKRQASAHWILEPPVDRCPNRQHSSASSNSRR